MIESKLHDNTSKSVTVNMDLPLNSLFVNIVYFTLCTLETVWDVFFVYKLNTTKIHHCGVVGRVPAFLPSDLGSIPGRVRNFNSYPGIGCVSFVCVLSCAVSIRGPDLVLITHSGRSALVYLSSVLGYLTHGHLSYKSWGVLIRRLGEGKYMKKKKKEHYKRWPCKSNHAECTGQMQYTG